MILFTESELLPLAEGGAVGLDGVARFGGQVGRRRTIEVVSSELDPGGRAIIDHPLGDGHGHFDIGRNVVLDQEAGLTQRLFVRIEIEFYPPLASGCGSGDLLAVGQRTDRLAGDHLLISDDAIRADQGQG